MQRSAAPCSSDEGDSKPRGWNLPLILLRAPPLAKDKHEVLAKWRLVADRAPPFCHFDRSIVFSLAFAQNRGFCAKEERQRSEVARRVYAACLERSLPRRARGEIPERKRRTKGRRPRFIVKFLSAIELTYSIIQLQLPTVNNCTPKKTGGARALRGRRRYAA